MHLYSLRGVSLFFAILLAGGCSSNNGGSSDLGSLGAPKSVTDFAIKIESDPAGADVFAMGEKIGTTPLVISSNDVFPNQYSKEKEPFYGKVTLRKIGCTDLTRTVDKKLVLMRAQLECGQPGGVVSEKPKPSPDAAASAEQRLTRIKELLDKGLITEEEARKARERIINEL